MGNAELASDHQLVGSASSVSMRKGKQAAARKQADEESDEESDESWVDGYSREYLSTSGTTSVSLTLVRAGVRRR